MYIATIPNRNCPPALLLRESFRQHGKVKNRTLANLSHWPAARIEALRRLLRGEFDRAVHLSPAPQLGPVFRPAVRAEAGGRRAGSGCGAGSQPIGETGLVFGVDPCGPLGFTAVGGALGYRSAEEFEQQSEASSGAADFRSAILQFFESDLNNDKKISDVVTEKGGSLVVPFARPRP